MSFIHKLAGQTAIYGLSSIVGRLLNFLLVPLYTSIFVPEEYGVLSELMAVIAFAMVVLTYGFETSFFHFTNKEKDTKQVLTTGFISLLVSSILFASISWYNAENIASLFHLSSQPKLIHWIIWIITLDVLSTLPFAKLRVDQKAWRFAFIRIVNVVVNIGFNLFFFLACPYLQKEGLATNLLDLIYMPDLGIGYIFISNLLASATMLLLLTPEILKINGSFSLRLWKKMAKYGFPLLVGGLAYVTNEMADRLLLEYLLPDDIATAEVGIYSACYKISIFMTLFIQAFRYGAEPFFFAQAKEKDAKEQYATVMRYFIAFTGFIFLGINVFIDLIKHFIQNEAYHTGLTVVPILLLANLFLGVYYNLSVWYKVSEKTQYGAYISVFGAIITILFNIILIPTMSYVGSAWATLICYASMCIVSFLLSRRHYPIQYNWTRISFYLVSALSLFLIWDAWHDDFYITSSIVCLLYILGVFLLEKRKKIPILIGD